MTSEIVRDEIPSIYCLLTAGTKESNGNVKFSVDKNFHESSFIIFVFFREAVVSEFLDKKYSDLL